MPNKLANQTSPYLLQHADNPVDWYPWGEEALLRARAEGKPIFLSIGYAACHWCHVMAHESFEDPVIAALMNEHFINIKVDREERPDLDSIYMSATVALTGSGGWPMSVFLTPDLRPFYAGTYFPPAPRYNMPTFRDVLTGIADAWQKERNKISRVAEQVLENIQNNAILTGKAAVPLTQSLLDNAADHLQKTYDWGFGGWGEAPKFPQPFTIEFLLDRATQTGQPEKRRIYLKTVSHVLHSMARGGIYDVVGGGFARYSTDSLWRVPHFEKMLYDNAQLSRAYLRAYLVTGEPQFRQVCEETLDFIQHELTHPAGGFFDTRTDHETLLLRPRDLQDNTTPSGNALAVNALLQLAAYGDRPEWRTLAEENLLPLLETAVSYPTAFAKWLSAADFSLGPVHEIAIIGNSPALINTLWKAYRPRLIAAIAPFPPPPGSPALLAERPLLNNQPTAYLCQGFICRQPVTTPKDLAAQLGDV